MKKIFYTVNYDSLEKPIVMTEDELNNFIQTAIINNKDISSCAIKRI